MYRKEERSSCNIVETARIHIPMEALGIELILGTIPGDRNVFPSPDWSRVPGLLSAGAIISIISNTGVRSYRSLYIPNRDDQLQRLTVCSGSLSGVVEYIFDLLERAIGCRVYMLSSFSINFVSFSVLFSQLSVHLSSSQCGWETRKRGGTFATSLNLYV